MKEIILEHVVNNGTDRTIKEYNDGELCYEFKNISEFLEKVNPDDAEFWNMFDYQDVLRGELNSRGIIFKNGKYFIQEA